MDSYIEFFPLAIVFRESMPVVRNSEATVTWIYIANIIDKQIKIKNHLFR